MFEKIGTKFESWKGEDQNSNVWKDGDGMPAFEWIGPEFQCL